MFKKIFLGSLYFFQSTGSIVTFLVGGVASWQQFLQLIHFLKWQMTDDFPIV